MLPKDTAYPLDAIPEENYFGEFRELSNSIGPSVKKDKDKGHHNPDNYNPDDDTYNEFLLFPKN